MGGWAAGDVLDDGLWAFDPSAVDWSNLPTIQVFSRDRTPFVWWSRARAVGENPSKIGCASKKMFYLAEPARIE